ncbi:MAG: vitamin B12 dependent-methionine synthase activation domain-containing protein [Planctomycetota bacterium]
MTSFGNDPNPFPLPVADAVSQYRRFIYRFIPERYVSIADVLVDDDAFFEKLHSLDRKIKRSVSQPERILPDELALYAAAARLCGIEPPAVEPRGGLTTDSIRAGFIQVRDAILPLMKFFLEVGHGLKAVVARPAASNRPRTRRALLDALKDHIADIEPTVRFYMTNAEPDADGLTIRTPPGGSEESIRLTNPGFRRFFRAPLRDSDDQEYEEYETIQSTAVVEERFSRPFIAYCTTIGPTIDRIASDAAKSGDIATALFVNAIGAGAADAVAEDLNLFLNEIYLPTTPYAQTGAKFRRLSPGYGGWDLSDQKPLDMLLDFSKIGVRLSDDHVMYPEKSTTGIMGLKFRQA